MGFHNTSVSLRRSQGDPSDFVLGAFLIHTQAAVMVAKTMRPVANFAANQTAHLTFNYTSLPGNRDCILLAWLPDSSPGRHFAQSDVFSVADPEATTSGHVPSGISSTLSGSRAAPLGLGATRTSAMVNTAGSPESTLSGLPSSPASSVSGTASSSSPNPTSRTIIIVGVVLGVLALGCVISSFIFLLFRQRRLKAAAPFLHHRDSLAPSFLAHSSMTVSQEPEAVTHTPISEVPRDQLEAEMARMREEIITLRSENRIRRMESGYSSLPPPSYRSTFRTPQIF
ncbi:hypothetical protein IW261DRAFT_1498034 [Armillaria novae-zelandiae]|uniref:Mid2 domain-containing protein n=1 Tax=Armillaria novae-zelandiae TaxID=153914 RepID=A0AA39UA75_9AGAR|nr:hypothetical protein IW261DRAFT_1498034 [Armillaria novae-zelandiae]